MTSVCVCLLIFTKLMILCQGRHCGVLCGNMVVPDCLIDLVRSFHDGMVATVEVGGKEAPPFQVRNGLRQGCTIASTLFIYLVF